MKLKCWNMDGITGAIEGYNRPGRALLWDGILAGPQWATMGTIGWAGIGRNR